MNIHKNARLTPIRREEMARSVISGRVSKAQAARDYGVSPKIVSRWTGRFLAEGRGGMQDRSSRPRSIPNQTAPALAERITTLRRQRRCGLHIALETGVSPATVSRVLRRAGLSRLKDLTQPEPIVRYEYKEPGGLIHLDIKKLGRFERVGHRITGDRTGQSNGRGVGWDRAMVRRRHCLSDQWRDNGNSEERRIVRHWFKKPLLERQWFKPQGGGARRAWRAEWRCPVRHWA